jgi:hypothetical protein
LVCEGYKDRSFFNQLIEERQLPRFHILKTNGNSNFFSELNALQLQETTRFRALRGIIIAADNNDDPAGRFQNVCDQVERVFGRGTAPSTPLQPSRTSPPVTVLMVPWTNRSGNLESLCVEAAKSANGQVARHVDTFMGLIHAEKWQSESRRGKAVLRVTLAATCVQDPFIPLGGVFEDPRHRRLIPLNHQSFTPIADELAKLA